MLEIRVVSRRIERARMSCDIGPAWPNLTVFHLPAHLIARGGIPINSYQLRDLSWQMLYLHPRSLVKKNSVSCKASYGSHDNLALFMVRLRSCYNPRNPALNFLRAQSSCVLAGLNRITHHKKIVVLLYQIQNICQVFVKKLPVRFV